MSKVNISIKGSIDDCIDDLALTMLQHEKIKNIVLGAAVKMVAITALGHKAKAELIAKQMEAMINQN